MKSVATTTKSRSDLSVMKINNIDENMVKNYLSHLRKGMRKSSSEIGKIVEKEDEKGDEKVSPKLIKSPSTGLTFSSLFSSFSHAKNEVEKYLSQIPFSSPLLLIEGVRKNEKISTLFHDGTKCSLLYPLYEIPRESEKPKIPLMNLYDIENEKTNSEYLVEGFLFPQTTGMFVSGPGRFKSFVALHMGLQVASGGLFLGRNCKQTGVLYFDAENNMSILKDRITKLTGDIDKDIPFFIGPDLLLINQKKQIQQDNIDELKKIIIERKIGLIILDTLHRFCFYDENSSDDINLVYMQAFKPLIKEGVTIVFLHHTTKDNKYRGSGDLLGQLDVSYKFDVKERKSNIGIFTITNEKNRTGEIEPIKAEIIFSDTEICINPLDIKNETAIEKSKKEQSKTFILEYLQDNTDGMSRKDLFSLMSHIGTDKTHDRAIKELKEDNKIKVLNNKFFYKGSKTKKIQNTSERLSESVYQNNISYDEVIRNKQLETGDLIEMPAGNFIRGGLNDND